jgi:hypothetical protein
MAHHRLPAGTDVAEMALFDVDALPQSRPPNGDGLDELVSTERLIRLPTGADGGYLLHLYVDEPPPEQVMCYCLTEDRLSGQFTATGGRIAFGGVESTFQDFKPNRFIRSDAVIPAGRYVFTAYRTDIPDEVVTQATQVASTSKERWLDRAPLLVTLTTLVLAFAFAVFKSFLAAGLVLVLGYLSFKAAKRLPGQGALAARREETQLDFPSIVIEMRSNPSIQGTPEKLRFSVPSGLRPPVAPDLERWAS